MNDAARALGIVPQIHVCGKCETIIPELIEEGHAAWQSAQPMNDLEAIIQTFGDRLTVIGGYDTQGPCALPTASDEEIITEVRCCTDAYGRFGRGYGFFGFMLGSISDPKIAHQFDVMFAEVASYAGAPVLDTPASLGAFS